VRRRLLQAGDQVVCEPAHDFFPIGLTV